MYHQDDFRAITWTIQHIFLAEKVNLTQREGLIFANPGISEPLAKVTKQLTVSAML